MTKQCILQILNDHRKQLAGFGAKQIGLFGVFAKDKGSPEMDIDFMVDLQPDKSTFINFMSLVAYLEHILDHKVNLLLMRPKTPYICSKILEGTEYIAISDSVDSTNSLSAPEDLPAS